MVVSKRLGHANVSITSDIYAHSLPGWQKQAADAFAEAMNADNADNPYRPFWEVAQLWKATIAVADNPRQRTRIASLHRRHQSVIPAKAGIQG